MVTYINRQSPGFTLRIVINGVIKSLQFQHGVLEVDDEDTIAAIDKLREAKPSVARNVQKVDRNAIEVEAKRLKALQKLPNAMKGGLTSAIPEKAGAAPAAAALDLQAKGASADDAAAAAKAVADAKTIAVN